MRVYILTEGGSKTGLGHIMRCSALAEGFASDGKLEPYFIINGEADIAGFKFEKCDWILNTERQNILDKISGYPCVIDSYLADCQCMKEIYTAAAKCLWIDDENLREYPGGVVVNPSLFGQELGYRQGLQYLLGEEYIILREAFRKTFERKINREVRTVTIIMGGTDVQNLTPKLADELGEFNLNVIISPLAGCFDELSKKPCLKVLANLSASEIAEVFLKSDLVVSAAGQTVYELIQTRTPSLLIRVAENQENNFRYVLKNRVALEYSLGNLARALDFSTREALCKEMLNYDFSKGVSNIAKQFMEVN